MRSRSSIRAGMKPGDGLDRRLVERLVVGDVRAGRIALGEFAVGLDIDLLDAAEAAELALGAIEIAVVVAVGGGESGLPPLVGDGDLLDDSAPGNGSLVIQGLPASLSCR